MARVCLVGTRHSGRRVPITDRVISLIWEERRCPDSDCVAGH